ncbi:MAG: TonB-dependent receptor [Acidobacteriota bacterium]|nr:TonB-dependent receptor [Acidobacteriota bacterium]
MRNVKRYSFLFFLCLCLPLLAQQTGTINGSVNAEDGSPLPGVTIVIQSPSLQGSRTDVSRETGAFIFRQVPPGIYTITLTMTGMQTIKQDVRVAVGSPTRPRFQMRPEATQETLVVTADATPALDTTTVATNLENDEFVNKLPRARSLDSVALLAPGVQSGAVGGISIQGATRVDNIYMLNGAIINYDNIRGSGSNSLFIQDDIQETQVMTGNISAEYGYFTGGVVNTITKSGSNQFHGIFRTAFEQEDWTGRTPFEKDGDVELDDTLNKIYTVTFNGPIIKDRLWFAAAGRNFDESSTATLVGGTPLTDAEAAALGLPPQSGRSAVSYPREFKRDRFQFKLTGTVVENHTLIASYLDNTRDETNACNPGPCINLSGLAGAATFPETLTTVEYRGELTPNMSLNIGWAEREGEISVGNSDNTLLGGTSLRHLRQGAFFGSYGNAPFGNANDPALRDSENWRAKLSYFITTDTMGVHDLTFGGSRLNEKREENNSQSASNWTLFPRWTRFEGTEAIPIFTPGFNSFALYWPVLNPSQGSEFITDALYVNDVWTLNDKWYFNIGLRYDKNDTKAQDGQSLSSSSRLSPRLTANWDMNGDGEHQFSVGYNEYTNRLNAAAAEGEIAGGVSQFAYFYEGPQTENISDVFAWFDANIPGGLEGIETRPESYSPSLPFYWFHSLSLSANPEDLAVAIQEGGLESAVATEYSFGYKKRLNNRGWIKGDLIYRDYSDFVVGVIDQTTGQNTTGVDRQIQSNDDGDYEREYFGVLLQSEYRINEKLNLGGNYTWSRSEGNISGVSAGGGAFASTSLSSYPEYIHPNLNPTGRFGDDRTHNLRFWALYDLETSFGLFNFSLLQSWQSGTPYGESISFDIEGRETAFGFPDPSTTSYNQPPSTRTYVITPDGFEWDDFLSTDLGINYSFQFPRGIELFAQFKINNIFNHDAVTSGVTTLNPISGASFNMFTEAPIEGTHYTRSSLFGQAGSSGDYQTPRSFSVDLGIRF